MLSIKSLVERLGVFERNRILLELKILSLAFYIQLSSLRKTAVWKCVRKLGEKVNVKPSRIHRRLITLDGACVKVNGLEYWVYGALDVDRNEIPSMKSTH